MKTASYTLKLLFYVYSCQFLNITVLLITWVNIESKYPRIKRNFGNTTVFVGWIVSPAICIVTIWFPKFVVFIALFIFVEGWVLLMASFQLANVNEVYDFPRYDLDKLEKDFNLNEADRKADKKEMIKHDELGLTCAFLVSLFHIVVYLALNIREYRQVYQNKKFTTRHLTSSLMSTYQTSNNYPEDPYSPDENFNSLDYASSSSSRSNKSSIISVLSAVRASVALYLPLKPTSSMQSSRRSQRKSQRSSVKTTIPGSTWSATTSNFGSQRRSHRQELTLPGARPELIDSYNFRIQWLKEEHERLNIKNRDVFDTQLSLMNLKTAFKRTASKMVPVKRISIKVPDNLDIPVISINNSKLNLADSEIGNSRSNLSKNSDNSWLENANRFRRYLKQFNRPGISIFQRYLHFSNLRSVFDKFR